MNKNLTTKLFDIQSLSLKKLFLGTQDVWNIFDLLEEFIGKNKVTHIDGVHIEGNVFIGKGSEVRKGAVLRGPVVIGENCVIGHNVEVVRSIVLDNAKIPHLNYVGDSIIGQRVNMGAGSICANVRLDKKEISLFGDVMTGRKKLGAIIGDDAAIGCNAVLNPGSVVLPGTFVEPCKNVGGLIE